MVKQRMLHFADIAWFLMLLLFACALPANAAQPSFTLTNRALVPDSASVLRASEFLASRGYGHDIAGKPLASNDKVLGPSFPRPFAETGCQPGCAKARCGVEVYSLVPRPWYSRRVSSYNSRQYAWATVGLAFQVASPRQVAAVKCSGRLNGHIRASSTALASLWGWSGLHGAFCTVGFFLEPGPDPTLPEVLRIPPSRSQWDAIFPVQSSLNLQTGILGEMESWGGAYKNGELRTKLQQEMHLPLVPMNKPLKESIILYPDRWYYACLALDLRYLAPSYGSLSDYEIDFYSGDYGAYFDSLEIELEPVKQPSKS